MTAVKTQLDQQQAHSVPFQKTADVSATDTQRAIEAVADAAIAAAAAAVEANEAANIAMTTANAAAGVAARALRQSFDAHIKLTAEVFT